MYRPTPRKLGVHARLVRFGLKPGARAEFESLYASRILPALEGTAGFLGAALLSHLAAEEAIVSLTFWRERGAAEAYDRTGRFARLLNEAEALIAEEGEAGPVLPAGGDVSVEGYAAELLVEARLAGALLPGCVARTVTLRVDPGMREEFDRRYRAEVATARQDFPGLVAVLLLHAVERPGLVVGLSVWRGEDDAARYDLSGRFQELGRDLSETLSPAARWRAAWSAGGDTEGAPDLEVDLYRVRLARAI
ncbi:hypothetical protein FBQ97_21110 [Acidobacteria bacterium ACD]|nr:MAG: hypothetical protein EDX89_02270 [Acidobacteriota bacterium]MCE7956940.1 hypothetical protein [Acidobacteria bacterium ACB2]MDL1952287.1 hypothetical protein [Acidobacteria bacterium ACD]